MSRTGGRGSHITISRSFIQRNQLGRNHSKIKVGPIMTIVPMKDVKESTATNSAPLKNRRFKFVNMPTIVFEPSRFVIDLIGFL